MITPFGQAATPDFADELMAEAGSRLSARQERDAAERRAMSPEQLKRLEKQIEALKERGSKGEDVYEQCRSCAGSTIAEMAHRAAKAVPAASGRAPMTAEAKTARQV